MCVCVCVCVCVCWYVKYVVHFFGKRTYWCISIARKMYTIKIEISIYLISILIKQ